MRFHGAPLLMLALGCGSQTNNADAEDVAADAQMPAPSVTPVADHDSGPAAADARADSPAVPGRDAATDRAEGGMPGPGDIVVALDVPHQKMDGFGASDKAQPTVTDEQADLFFSETKGIGLSILRVAITEQGEPSTGYGTAQKASARGAIVWGAPWSPPAELKDNASLTNGGHLLASGYDAWATTLAGFAEKMAGNGVPVYGISVQNEPDYVARWNSCIYSGKQMTEFVKVLGPKLAALTPRPKLILPETSSWSGMWSTYASAILADATATSYADILATHQYSVADPPKHAIPQGKVLWETEVSSFDAATASMDNAIQVAKWIHNAVVHGGVSAWHYWWLIGRKADNQGLLAMDGSMTKRFYAMGNYSKFVRPGYERVDVSGAVPAGVYVSAYRGETNQAVVLVVINDTDSAAPLSFALQGRSSPAQLTPWTTSGDYDLAAGTDVVVGGGAMTVTVAPKSVTTFVGTH